MNTGDSSIYSFGVRDGMKALLAELCISTDPSLVVLKSIEESLEETKRITSECFSELARLRCELEARDWDHAEGEGRR